MPTPTDIERISYGGSVGSIQLGAHREVIQGAGATRTLLAKESGALVLFDRAAGIVFTLPTAVEGMFFEFHNTVTVTTNSAKTITAAATQFIMGTIDLLINGAATSLAAFANGTTHVAITENGSTTGGVQGGRYRLTATSSGLWVIDGYTSASGVLATPFATT